MMIFLLPLLSHSTDDPDPLQDFCVGDPAAAAAAAAAPSLNGFPCKPTSAVTSDDFCFDALTKEGNMSNISGSEVNPDNVLTFPALNTLGISMNRVNFAPGGYNPPHSLPRATEAAIILKGKVLVGLVTTRNKYYSKVLSPWQMFVIPRGLVHFQLNVGKGKALAITTFNSQLPRSLSLPKTIFASDPPIPEQFLNRAFEVEADVIEPLDQNLVVKRRMH